MITKVQIWFKPAQHVAGLLDVIIILLLSSKHLITTTILLGTTYALRHVPTERPDRKKVTVILRYLYYNIIGIYMYMLPAKF